MDSSTDIQSSIIQLSAHARAFVFNQIHTALMMEMEGIEMSTYKVSVYDSAENCYLGGFIIFNDSLNDAIQAAIELTKAFVEQHIDYLEADVFMYCRGRGEYQLIGYVSYDCETLDVESIEFEECFS